ncbi:MAG TPA: YtxH domain-containing protein [Acidobacteriota bacterium]|nr:YtxH domain-containing protein [Acidobacteriota bacterium]
MARIKNSTARTALVAVTAGLIGASVALLLAPQSGRKTRKKLRRAGYDIARRGELFCEDLNHSIRELVEELEEASVRGIDRGREAGTRIYSEIIDSLEAGKETISRQIDRLRQRAGY